MKKLILFCCLMIMAVNLFAIDNSTVWWQTANKYYEQKKYDSAVVYYEKISASKPQNEVVYFNLGNAYYKLNQITLSIVNYEKALQINPGYTQAKDNLSIAQSRITNPIQQSHDIFFIRWWHTITSADKSGMWAITSLLLFLCLMGYGILKQLNRAKINMPVQLIAGAWGIFLLLIVFSFVSARNQSVFKKAVVSKNETPFYTSPQQTKPAAYIPEGTTLKTGNQLQGWIEVSLPDGRNGWIPANTIIPI